jgi:Fe-Mn family superoxide dismutase
MKYSLPRLPYAYDALEPYIDRLTMELHYTKHHQAYVDHLNAALEKYPHLQEMTLDALLKNIPTLPAEIQTVVRNNAGGHFNHTLFWPLMKKNGGGQPKGRIADAIQQTFGEFKNFQDQFTMAAKGVFGSGWAWLAIDSAGALKIIHTPNQDAPIMQQHQPVFGLDVWEHAYYLKYHNRRPDYITAWWHVVNWDHVEELYRGIIG